MTAEIHRTGTPAELISALTHGNVQDPYPLYDELREVNDGVHWAEELGGWLCTRYDDVRSIYTDPEVFSSDFYSSLIENVHGVPEGEHERFMAIFLQQFMLTDPPAHTQIRSLLRGAFTPRALTRWPQMIAQITDELLEEVNPGADIDVMADFAPRVPIQVIAAMLGIPPEDTARFRVWTDAFVGTFNPRIAGDERDRIVSESLALFEYLEDLVEHRRVHPAGDLITLVATASVEDDGPLTVSKAVAQLALLLAAGNETMANLIGSGMTMLIENPRAQQRLREDPGLVGAAIEEMLRLDPPFHLVPRRVTKSTTMGGHQLEPGQLCWGLLSSANRDPRIFPNAGTFRINRDTNPHLSFVHGIHFCLGAPLARMEGEIVFSKLLQRYPGLTAGAQPAVRKTEAIVARGWRTRPVRLGSPA